MDRFVSPSRGSMTFDDMFRDIMSYVEQSPNDRYRLIIGTDSQSQDDLTLVTAVIIHRVGKGGRYYYQRSRHRAIKNLQQKIYYETSVSLGLGSKLAKRLAENGYANMNIEIHLDVGTAGPTKEMIREVVGMVTGSGFDARIKPDSFGASTVADRYSK